MIHEMKIKTIGPLHGVPLVKPELFEEIDAYAHRHGLALAEAVWCLIKAGLDAEGAAMLQYERERVRESADPFVW
jgi:hypothetical protein